MATRQHLRGGWDLVVYSGECNADGDCPFCMIDYGECPCPGPTMDDEYDYKTVNGVLYARKKDNGDDD